MPFVLLRPDTAIPLGMRFLTWYIREPRVILTTAGRYSKAFDEILSISFLLRTLFAPWKNIVERPRGGPRGLNVIASDIAFNIISRCIGAVIRIAALAVALVMQAVLLTYTIAYLLLWILYPLAVFYVIASLIIAATV